MFFSSLLSPSLAGELPVVSMDGGERYSTSIRNIRSTAMRRVEYRAAYCPIELRVCLPGLSARGLVEYLQLPGNLDPRIARLAQQITASKSNNYEKAASIENYLRTNFEYTLQLPLTFHRDPLANLSFRAQARPLRVLCFIDGDHASHAGHSITGGKRLSHRGV